MNELVIDNNVHELAAFHTWLEDGKIIRTKVKNKAVITIEQAEENVKVVRQIAGDNTYPILVDIRDIKSISKEAREVFSQAGERGHVNAIALIIRSPLSKMIGNFFIGRNRPDLPTRLFTREKQAMNWLLEQ